MSVRTCTAGAPCHRAHGLTHPTFPVQSQAVTMRNAALAETSGRPFECSQGTQWPQFVFRRVGRSRRSAKLLTTADSRSSRRGTDTSDLARMESAVPMDQRPATQLKELRDSQLYSWATLDREAYLKRIAFLFTGSFCLLGGPIAYQTFDPLRQTAEFLLSGALGAGFVVSLAVIRIYLGWSYVGNRLLSAAVAYEETGWYDGQTFVKPPEVLTRDRLLGTYEVKPTLARLKATLLGTGSSLLVSAVLLLGLINSQADADGMIGRGAAAPRLLPGGEGILYSKSVKSLADLKSDDEAAAAEAAAQGGEYPPPDGCLYEEPYHAQLCALDSARPLGAKP